MYDSIENQGFLTGQICFGRLGRSTGNSVAPGKSTGDRGGVWSYRWETILHKSLSSCTGTKTAFAEQLSECLDSSSLWGEYGWKA